jgi:hypothetical protein
MDRRFKYNYEIEAQPEKPDIENNLEGGADNLSHDFEQ